MKKKYMSIFMGFFVLHSFIAFGSSTCYSAEELKEIRVGVFSCYGAIKTFDSFDPLTGYIKHALGYISVNQYADWQIKDDESIYPTPTLAEQNLIAMVAGVIIDPGNQSIRTPDFAVTVKNPMSTSDMVSKMIAIFKKSPAGLFAICGGVNNTMDDQLKG